MSWTSFEDLQPRAISTVAELAMQLSRLRVRAGGLSLRYFEKWAEEQRRAGRRMVSLSRTNISDALNGKRLPRKDFVRWYVEACGVPEDLRDEWLRAWERAADHKLLRDRDVDNPAPVLVVTENATRSDVGAPVARSVSGSAGLRGGAESSDRIQPLFVHLLVVTAYMRRREVSRRVTERLITARRDGLEYYAARGFLGRTDRAFNHPTEALWGCEAENVDSTHPRWPATLLRFPRPLRRGESAHFASETTTTSEEEERWWVDVGVDHHGIARGRIARDGLVPTEGLAIRIRFDADYIPEAVWWYADMTEAERYLMPEKGDARLLVIEGRDVQYTFTENDCQTGRHYGLAFRWPLA